MRETDKIMINLYKPMSTQLEFFVDKFKEIGWKQEDLYYIHKNVGFEVNPDAKNDDCKFGFGIVFFTELLSYSHTGGVDVLTPWVVGRIQIDNEYEQYPADGIVIREVAKYMKSEFGRIGINPFYDEDAFLNNFTRPEFKHLSDTVEIKFYLNTEYPNGHWENHTI